MWCGCLTETTTLEYIPFFRSPTDASRKDKCGGLSNRRALIQLFSRWKCDHNLAIVCWIVAENERLRGTSKGYKDDVAPRSGTQYCASLSTGTKLCVIARSSVKMSSKLIVNVLVCCAVLFCCVQAKIYDRKSDGSGYVESKWNTQRYNASTDAYQADATNNDRSERLGSYQSTGYGSSVSVRFLRTQTGMLFKIQFLLRVIPILDREVLGTTVL